MFMFRCLSSNVNLQSTSRVKTGILRTTNTPTVIRLHIFRLVIFYNLLYSENLLPCLWENQPEIISFGALKSNLQLRVWERNRPAAQHESSSLSSSNHEAQNLTSNLQTTSRLLKWSGLFSNEANMYTFLSLLRAQNSSTQPQVTPTQHVRHYYMTAPTTCCFTRVFNHLYIKSYS